MSAFLDKSCPVYSVLNLNILFAGYPARTLNFGNVAIMSEAQGVLSRINGLQDVIGTMIVGANGNVLRTTLPQDLAFKYATKIPSLAAMARSGVRELDPQNDLQMLRIKTLLHEIIVIAEPLFTLLVVQNCKEKEPTPESSLSPDEDRSSSND